MGENRGSKAAQAVKFTPHPTVLDDIDDGEDALTLAAAAGLPEIRRNGRAPAASTLWRWASSGVAGVKLEVARVGGSLVTSRSAVRRFLARLADPKTSSDMPTPGEAALAHQRAGAELDAAGVR